MSDAAIQAGQELVEHFEGCHEPLSDGTFAPYICPAGVWTIGWGSTKDQNGQYVTRWTPPHTQEQCDHLLTDSLEDGYSTLEATIPYWDEMHHDMQGALISFGYNLGYHFYNGEDFDTITRELKNKNWPAVPDALMLYVNPGSPYEAGLTRRREAEGELWNNGLNQLETTPPPEPPMTQPTTTFDDFLNTYKYWNGEQHQINAADIAYQALWYTDRIDAYFESYRTPATPEPPAPPTTPPVDEGAVLVQGVPYYNQRDNGIEGDRECFATSCAMIAVYHYNQTNGAKGCKNEAEYLNKFPAYGDSTDANTHLRTLSYFGLTPKFITTGSVEDLKAELNAGRPAACGWLHHGHVSHPSGGGHYSTVVGYDDEQAAWIFHDPYGEANLVAGGYVHLNSTSPAGVTYGEHIRYSYQNWTPRWSVADLTDGWYMKVSA